MGKAQRICAGLFSLLLLFCFSTAKAAPPPEQATFSTEKLVAFNGSQISKIEFEGLRWTREAAARALLSLHEGEIFNAEQWLFGLHKLYDTGVLYDIETRLKPAGDDHSVAIVIQLTDRWTLLPFAFAQTGGGSNSYSVGIVEQNLLGSFAQTFVGYGVFDNVSSYEINFFQEFYRDLDIIWGLDFSQIGTPVQLQLNDGSVAGTYSRVRLQEQALLGYKWAEKKIRLLTFLETFSDQLAGRETGVSVAVTQGTQYRIRPNVIVGRSELTNFLEQGSEFSLLPTLANMFDSRSNYFQLVLTYKKIFLKDNTNYALFFNFGAMSPAETPYQFRLGGYDTIRGFTTNRAIGRFYAINSLEFRPYFFRVSSELIGQIVVQGCVFQDVGIMHDANHFDAASASQAKDFTMLSEGVGLRLSALKFAGAVLRIDVAKAVVPNEGLDVSLGLGQFF